MPCKIRAGKDGAGVIGDRAIVLDSGESSAVDDRAAVGELAVVVEVASINIFQRAVVGDRASVVQYAVGVGGIPDEQARAVGERAVVIQRPCVGEEGERGGLARATGVRDRAVVSERAAGTDVYTTSGEIAVNQTTTGVGDRAEVGKVGVRVDRAAVRELAGV